MGFVERTPRACGPSATSSATTCPAGPVSLVTHSGSVFSALLRTHRAARLRPRRVVRPGAGHDHAPTTSTYARRRHRDPGRRRWCSRPSAAATGSAGRCAGAPRGAASRWSLLPSAARRPAPALVAAHSGALAGSDRRSGRRCPRRTACTGRRPRRARRHAWNVRDRRRRGRRPRGPGIATVHDSGAERSLVADLAARLGVPFAPLSARPHSRRSPTCSTTGLEPSNPLDVWGGGADTHRTLRRLPGRDGRRPGGRRDRPGRRPGAGVRRRHVLPRRAARGRGRRPRRAGGRADRAARRPSTRTPPTGCARPASRCWKGSAAGCSRCATCSTPSTGPLPTRWSRWSRRRRRGTRVSRSRPRWRRTGSRRRRNATHRSGGRGRHGGRGSRLAGRPQDGRTRRRASLRRRRRGHGPARRRRRRGGVRGPRRSARARGSVHHQSRPASSSRSASCGTTPSARWSWSRRAASSSSCCRTAPSPCRRCPATQRDGWWTG